MAVRVCVETKGIQTLATLVAQYNVEISDKFQAGKEGSRVPCGRTDATSHSTAQQPARPFLGLVSRGWYDRPTKCRSGFVPWWSHRISRVRIASVVKDESIVGSPCPHPRHTTSMSADFALLREAQRGLSRRSIHQPYSANA